MKFKIKSGPYISPYQDIIQQLHHKQVREDDYFKSKKICLMGARRPIQNYGGIIPDEDLIGWGIRKTDFLNMTVIARSGAGKTATILKPLLNQYYKQGFKILVFCPKKDEWSIVKRKGKGTRLHQFQKNEKMNVVSYSPSFVKNYLEKNDEIESSYKFYSYPIKTFIYPEVWGALGFTPTASSHCVGLVNQGVSKLKELQDKIKYATNLLPISRNSAVDKIESLQNAKFFNDTLKKLDFEKEWDENNNVIAINYFAQRGFMMSFDVWMLIEEVRKYCQRKQTKGIYQPVIILFDDANFYASPKDSFNHHSIKAILDTQSNYRSYGMNPIVSYQLPEMVDEEIRKSSEKYILSSLYDVSALKGAIPEDVRYMLSAKMENNGLFHDKYTYTREWVLVDDREGYRFFPMDCNIGHNYF